jgi:hypothetical protein
MKKSIRLSIKPKWGEIEKIRNNCSKFMKSHGFSDNTVYALTMVISELVENSIKYGNFQRREDKVIISIHVGEDIVTIEVINPVNKTVYKHLENLDKTIQWIRGYQDPFEAYVERLKDVSKKPFRDDESGLGLARIAYEGKAIVDFFVGENDTLNVSALANY